MQKGKKWSFYVIVLLVMLFLTGCVEGVGSVLQADIAGVVKNQLTGLPIANAQVTVQNHVVYTNENGAFAVSKCLLGNYTLAVKADGYKDTETMVVLNRRINKTEVTLLPYRPGSFLVYALDFDGKPLSNDQIDFKRNGVLANRFWTDGNGMVVAPFSTGTYTVTGYNMDGNGWFSYSSKEVSIQQTPSIALYFWSLKPENIFYQVGQDRYSNYVQIKNPPVTWPTLNLVKQVRYEISVYKWTFVGRSGSGCREQMIKTDTNSINLSLTTGGMYSLTYNAYNGQTGELLSTYDGAYFRVNTDVAEQPASSEEWVNYLENQINKAAEAFSTGWTNFESYLDFISDNYTDNLGRNKQALLESLKARLGQKMVVYNLQVQPVMEGNELKSASADADVFLVKDFPGMKEKVHVELGWDNGKVRIMSAVITKNVTSTNAVEDPELFRHVQ